MPEQLALFDAPPVVVTGVAPKLRPGDLPQNPDTEWPYRTWRWVWGVGAGIEYRYPDPLWDAPPPLRGGEWRWNQLFPDWQLDYPAPPFALTPRGVTADAHGAKLLPPPGFALINARRLAGRCPHCNSSSGTTHPAGPWAAWHDPRVAAAFHESEAAGQRCYGSTILDVPGLGPIEPLGHYSRWGAGYCTRCGAVLWHDFRREHWSHYFRPPVHDRIGVEPRVHTRQ